MLTDCRDCGHQVSRSAEACPSCGCKLRTRWDHFGLLELIPGFRDLPLPTQRLAAIVASLIFVPVVLFLLVRYAHLLEIGNAFARRFARFLEG
jgi:hypothetical protein